MRRRVAVAGRRGRGGGRGAGAASLIVGSRPAHRVEDLGRGDGRRQRRGLATRRDGPVIGAQGALDRRRRHPEPSRQLVDRHPAGVPVPDAAQRIDVERPRCAGVIPPQSAPGAGRSPVCSSAPVRASTWSSSPAPGAAAAIAGSSAAPTSSTETSGPQSSTGAGAGCGLRRRRIRRSSRGARGLVNRSVPFRGRRTGSSRARKSTTSARRMHRIAAMQPGS